MRRKNDQKSARLSPFAWFCAVGRVDMVSAAAATGHKDQPR